MRPGKRIVRGLLWLGGLGLLWLVVLTVPLADTLAILGRLQWGQLTILALLNGLVLAVMNGRWWLILRGQGFRLPFFTLLGYRLAAFGLSYFTPGPQFGGEPFQVYLLERRHRMPRAAAVATLALDKSLELAVNFAFLVAGVFILGRVREVDGVLGTRAVVVALLLLALPVLYLLALRLKRQPIASFLQFLSGIRPFQTRPAWAARFQKALKTVRESEMQAARFFQAAPRLFVSAFLVSIVGWLLLISEYWLMLTFLGLPLTLIQTIVALTAVRIAFLLPLPGGLGTLEASQVLALSLMGFDPAAGISAGLLIRARDVLLGGMGLWWGTVQLGRTSDSISGTSSNRRPLVNS